MTRRWTGLLLVLALATTGCASRLGTGSPACDLEFSDVGTATIMMAQAVPTAAWGPCLADLAPGWELHNSEPSRGRAGFSIDSDRVGIRFVDVQLLESCEPSAAAVDRTPPNDEIARLVEERETTEPLPITLVPVATRHVDAVFAIAQELLETRVDGHRISVRTAPATTDPAGAITAGLEAGRYVLIVDDPTLTHGMLELRDPADPGAVEHDDLDDLLDDIAEKVGTPAYAATWWHLFEGGCIVVEFDARGPGAEAIASRVETAIGFYPLDDLRAYAAENGVVFGAAP